jgi:hypothetical protein
MSLKIHFEIATPWFNHHLVGGMIKNMTANFIAALDNVGVEYNCFEYDPDSRDIYNKSDDDTIIFCYHKKGHRKNTWYIKESALYDFFSIDQGGYAGWSDFSLNKPRDEFFFNHGSFLDFSNKYRESRLSKYPQISQESGLSGSYIFYPLQISDDSVIEFSRFNFYEAILMVGQAAAYHGKELLIKRHPLCLDENVSELLDVLIKSFDNIKMVSNNIHDIIKGADAIICCNSGVGLEALMYSKKVYSYGHSEYAMASHAILTEFELDNIFKDNFSNYKADVSVDRFIESYLGDYCFDANNIKSIEMKIHKAINCFSKINFN